MFDFDSLESDGESIVEATASRHSSGHQQPDSPCHKKLRVLCLPGGGGNANIMKFQVMNLKRALGEMVEFEYLNGGFLFEFEGDYEPEMGVMAELADGMPPYTWYKSDGDPVDPEAACNYEKVEEGIDRLLWKLGCSEPFDVLVGFSQGVSVITMTAGTLRARNEAIPWRMNILVGGLGVSDPKYRLLADPPLDIPTVMIFGRIDAYYDRGKCKLVPEYKDPHILEHEEGHKFPTLQPRANEIYDAVKRFVAHHCNGQQSEAFFVPRQ